MGDPFVINQPIKLENVVFAQATTAQWQTAAELSAQAWAGDLSTADYIAVKELVRQTELSREGGATTWVLSHKDNPSQIIASCSTIRKEVLIADAEGLREATGYAVASVFTNPRYRRLGMSSHLLRCVQEEVIDQSSECSALYSDIGKRYYAELGWSTFPAAQATLSLLVGKGTAISQAHCGSTRLLAKEELAPLCARDVERLKARFERLGDDGKTHVTFLPSWPQIAWQLVVEDSMARRLHNKAVEYCGAITAEGNSWIYWEHGCGSKELNILKIVTNETESRGQRVADAAALLEAALVEAAQWGFKKVLLWNPDDILTFGAKSVGNDHETEVSVVFDERLEASIPSFRWKGGMDVSNTVWEDNFYYAHC